MMETESRGNEQQAHRGLAPFLVEVLKASYVPTPMAALKFDRGILQEIAKASKRKLRFMKEYPWTESPRMGGKRIDPRKALADKAAYVNSLKGELMENVSKYKAGRRAFMQFMREHGDVPDYIATLAGDREWEAETPSEEAVFEVFKRLSRSPIIGEIGFDPEEVEIGSILGRVVRKAGARHAERTNHNPDEYLLRILTTD